MAFSKDKFFPSIAVKFDFPRAFGGGRCELSLAMVRTREYEIFRLALVSLTEEERTPEVIANAVRSFVCAQMDGEPVGLEDFPAPKEETDAPTLFERAMKYFSGNAPALQEFLDTIMMTAWLAHKEATEPDTFSGTIQNRGARASGTADKSA